MDVGEVAVAVSRDFLSTSGICRCALGDTTHSAPLWALLITGSRGPFLLDIMSSVYNLEPQPTAKVLLQTTAGDILLELFAKQTPFASRNFLQLCLDGYYNGTIFHRLVPGFVIQGGDPTGSGDGGEASCDGGTFADEFHPRLKFNRRGLLGMANSGRRDDNGSQFFLTLGKTAELDGQNTMFGRVVGDTIYNLVKMGEAELTETEGSERPLYPTTVTGAKILVNPFDDMVAKKAPVRAISQREEPRAKKPKKRAGKALLSFGGDEEEAVEPLPKKAKFNTDLVAAGTDKEDSHPHQASKKKAKSTPKPPPPKAPSRSPSPKHHPEANSHPEAQFPLPNDEQPSRNGSISSSNEPNAMSPGLTVLERTNAQIAELKASMKRTTMAKPEQKAQKKSALEQMIPANSIRGRKRKGNKDSHTDETRTMKALDAFRARLEQAPLEGKQPDTSKDNALNGTTKEPARVERGGDDADEAALCDLHFIVNCQSCQEWNDHAAEDGESEDDGKDWMSHALSFEKDRLGKDLMWKKKNEEELVVIDPREKAKDIKDEQRTRRKGKNSQSRAWDRDRDRDRDRGRLPERMAGARG